MITKKKEWKTKQETKFEETSRDRFEEGEGNNDIRTYQRKHYHKETMQQNRVLSYNDCSQALMAVQE